ncbi:MAG TPA: HAD family hydrolase [Terriglobales bacterium]|jgi:phosphoglycolate phosphatase-like HAD superfamily hydrolase|nr:HAD family hydrolase [Terriglobales bacterium]
MNDLRAVLFDVDGVLLDSLTPHLKICEDKSREYGLNLKIPTPNQFKKMVRSGVKISPMKYFFIAVGFPNDLAEKANEQYQRVFMSDYAPTPFPGVHESLRALYDVGMHLGIVTSNVRRNVVAALGPSFHFFQPDCVYTKDDIDGVSKSEAIMRAMSHCRVDSRETIYVGDQPADFAAAQEASTGFLGVTYGWGISEEDTEFPIARSVCDISQYVLAHAHTAA